MSPTRPLAQSPEPMTQAQLTDSERRLKESGTQIGLWELRALPSLGVEEVIKTSEKKNQDNLLETLVGMEGKMRLEFREVNPVGEKHIIGQLNIDKM